MNPNDDKESYSSVNFFYPKQECEEIWQLRKKPDDAGENIELQRRTATSQDDLSSLDSWTQSVLSAIGSTTSLDSGAFSSVNTTPADSPASTPTLKRKIKPALKLSFDDVTWTITKDKRHRSRRLKQNLQASSARVKAVMKQSKTPQFRFRMILLTLFALIVTIVSFTWHMYQRQRLQFTIGNKIRFHEARRVLHLLTDNGRELVEALLGTEIPVDLNPYHCDIHDPTSHLCEEWKYRAKLNINFTHSSNLSCYNVYWESLERHTILKDCVALKGANWYGMGLQRRLEWPLKPTLGTVAHPLVTGDGVEQTFGGVLDRYWLSSDGVAVIADPKISLYVSITDSSLCIESRQDREFPFQPTSDNFLNYTICTGGNMRTLHRDMMLKYRMGFTANKGRDFFNAPVWTIAPGENLTQTSVQDFSNRIMEHTSHLQGFILMDSRWQEQQGSLSFNNETFPDPPEILKILKHKGFQVLLSVHPYICLPSSSFEDAIKGYHLVSDQWKQVPLLTRWHSSVCGLLDLTENETSSWFVSRLQQLQKKYDIRGFVFTGGQTTYLPRSYSFHSSPSNPDMFLPYYLSAAEKAGPLLGTDVGFMTQGFPGFVRLTPRTVSWDRLTGLASVIPEVLTLGILGYPLINPGSVGGDGEGEVPSKELYLRWLELAVFLPVVQFTVPPGFYDQEVVDTVYRLFTIRKMYVLPVFHEALELLPEEGAPLIRPLWWIAPDDPHAQKSNSQFLVGQALMVAPVLEEGRRARDIYLPTGWWKDNLFGERRRGGKWLHNYPVPWTKVAYFSLIKETFE